MLRYLEHGWYEEKGKNRLRKEVIDGAMDAAGFLVRAEVSVDKLMLVALKIRSLVAIIDPLVRGSRKFGKVDREMIMVRLEPHLASCDAFEGFVADCLETVSGPHDLTAFYLHLIHISRMMQLLSHPTMGILTGGPKKTGKKTTKKVVKKAAAKKVAKKVTKKTTKKVVKKAAKSR